MIDLRRLAADVKRLDKSDGRIARRNARRRVLAALRVVRQTLNRDYPPIPNERRSVSLPAEHPALRDARRLSWRRWEWKYLNPGAASWDRGEAQAFVDFYAASIGQPSKPIVFDLPDRSRLLGQHASDRIRLDSHRFGHSAKRAAFDQRTKSGFRSVDWCKWRTLLHEVAHYRAHGHGSAFKRELWDVFQSWKRWRASRHGLAAAANKAECQS